MTSRLRVAVATVAIRRYRRLSEFQAHMEDIADQARARGAELLLLPELLCVGLLWTSDRAAATDVARVGDLYADVLTPLLPEYSRVLAGLAASSGLTVAGASFWHRDGDRRVNSGFVVKPDGEAFRQDKLHPTRPEQAIATSGGDRLLTFDVAGVRVGMAICYDIQFPEIARLLVEAGVEVILVPSLTSQRGYWRFRHCAHARAIENQLYVCVSPLIGALGVPVDRPLQGHGASLVTCPIDDRFMREDGVYARGDLDREGVLHVDLDLDLLRVSRARSEIMHLADRRPDLYRRLPVRTPRGSGDDPALSVLAPDASG